MRRNRVAFFFGQKSKNGVIALQPRWRDHTYYIFYRHFRQDGRKNTVRTGVPVLYQSHYLAVVRRRTHKRYVSMVLIQQL